jgi:hypothetical protein
VERALVAALVVALAAVVAVVVERRRRPDAPAQGSSRAWPVPTQLDRRDFDRPEAPWLVAIFTSATCESCAQAMTKARPLASEAVAVQEVEVTARADLHDRYSVKAVPTTVVADAEGVVRASFVGPPSASDLWAVVAGVRDAQAGEERPGPAPSG